MPRRRAITDAQLDALIALPTVEPDLIRHYTLSPADLAVIARRRRPHNRLGFALQLCALRYPGRPLRPGEVVPRDVLVFVADQLDLPPDVLADYATRPQTRYDQLEALYSVYGFQTFTRRGQHEFAQWLLPVALTTTSGEALAGLLLEELRRRAIVAPGPSVIERLVATTLLKAERHVDRQIDAGLTGAQREALEALLEIEGDTILSVLAWTRQAPGLAGHRALSRLIDRLARLRSLALDATILERIHIDRRRVLMREGMRLSAQHLKTLAPLRRRAILAVTALESITRLTDEAIGMFDRLIGGLFRRAERRAAEAFQANARAVNDKVRLLARLGDALIEARAIPAATPSSPSRPFFPGIALPPRSRKPKSCRARTVLITPPWRPPIMRFSVVSGRSSWTASASRGSPASGPSCVRSRSCGSSMLDHDARCPRTCHRALFAAAGGRRCFATMASMSPLTNSASSPNCATGCGPATSGWSEADNTGPWKTS